MAVVMTITTTTIRPTVAWALGKRIRFFFFGAGLSYTTFEISDLAVRVPGTHWAPATVEVSVANTGSRTGTETVQIYVEDPIMEYVRPWKRLLAFRRVELQPGETKRVAVDISADELAFHDDDMKLRLVPGRYLLSAGGNSYEAGGI